MRVFGLIAALAMLAGCSSRRAAVIEAPRVTARDTARVTIVTDSVRITDSARDERAHRRHRAPNH